MPENHEINETLDILDISKKFDIFENFGYF